MTADAVDSDFVTMTLEHAISRMSKSKTFSEEMQLSLRKVRSYSELLTWLACHELDRSQAYEVVNSICNVDTKQSRKLLKKLFLDDTRSLMVRRACLGTFLERSQEVEKQIQRELANDVEKEYALDMIFQLRFCGSVSSCEVVRKFSSDSDEDLRSAALEVLESLSCVVEPDELERFLVDASPQVRYFAIDLVEPDSPSRVIHLLRTIASRDTEIGFMDQTVSSRAKYRLDLIEQSNS